MDDCRPFSLGGYSFTFLEKPSQTWECMVCMMPLREPHLLSCCGVKICKSCIEKIRESEQSLCPSCREDSFHSMLDKDLQRIILSLRVQCELREQGCQWEGQLRDIEKHLSVTNDGGCCYVEVECRYECGKRMMRGDMKEHEEEQCLKRPIEVQLSKMGEKMELVWQELKIQKKAEICLKAKAIDQDQEIAQLKATIAEQRKDITLLQEQNEKLLQEQKQMALILEQQTGRPFKLQQSKKLHFTKGASGKGPGNNTSTGAKGPSSDSGKGHGNKSKGNGGKGSAGGNVNVGSGGVPYMYAYGRSQSQDDDDDPLELPSTSDSPTSPLAVTTSDAIMFSASSFSTSTSTGSFAAATTTTGFTSHGSTASTNVLPPSSTGLPPEIYNPSFPSSTGAITTWPVIMPQGSMGHGANYKLYSATVGGLGQPSQIFTPSCPVCLDTYKDPVETKCCKQKFCHKCLDESLSHSSYCPICKTALKAIMGNQPPGTMSHSIQHTPLPGYHGFNTIVINYHISSGIQGPEHPNPGQRFHGTTRTAYLPDNNEGRHVLSLLKRAFDARLIFTVGTSHTTGLSNTVVWNDIHHKTSPHGGPFGYPDPDYLSRVKEELKAKGIR